MRIDRMQDSDRLLVSATRGVIGVGIGLLAAQALSPRQRRNVGTLLAAAGLLAAMPQATRTLRVLLQRRTPRGHGGWDDARVRLMAAEASADH